MSLILKGINMPKDTISIEISFNLEDGSKGSTRIYKTSAIQIDRPHGRLIDGDELADIVDGTDWYHINRKGELVNGAGVEDEALYKADDILTTVNYAPTILDAED